jgi:hypothetical protein
LIDPHFATDQCFVIETVSLFFDAGHFEWVWISCASFEILRFWWERHIHYNIVQVEGTCVRYHFHVESFPPKLSSDQRKKWVGSLFAGWRTEQRVAAIEVEAEKWWITHHTITKLTSEKCIGDVFLDEMTDSLQIFPNLGPVALITPLWNTVSFQSVIRVGVTTIIKGPATGCVSFSDDSSVGRTET